MLRRLAERDDVMAAVLKFWRHLKTAATSVNEDLRKKHFLPNFIPIRFEMTRPWILKRSPQQQQQQEEQDE